MAVNPLTLRRANPYYTTPEELEGMQYRFELSRLIRDYQTDKLDKKNLDNQVSLLAQSAGITDPRITQSLLQHPALTTKLAKPQAKAPEEDEGFISSIVQSGKDVAEQFANFWDLNRRQYGQALEAGGIVQEINDQFYADKLKDPTANAADPTFAEDILGYLIPQGAREYGRELRQDAIADLKADGYQEPQTFAGQVAQSIVTTPGELLVGALAGLPGFFAGGAVGGPGGAGLGARATAATGMQLFTALAEAGGNIDNWQNNPTWQKIKAKYPDVSTKEIEQRLENEIVRTHYNDRLISAASLVDGLATFSLPGKTLQQRIIRNIGADIATEAFSEAQDVAIQGLAINKVLKQFAEEQGFDEIAQDPELVTDYPSYISKLDNLADMAYGAALGAAGGGITSGVITTVDELSRQQANLKEDAAARQREESEQDLASYDPTEDGAQAAGVQEADNTQKLQEYKLLQERYKAKQEKLKAEKAEAEAAAASPVPSESPTTEETVTAEPATEEVTAEEAAQTLKEAQALLGEKDAEAPQKYKGFSLNEEYAPTATASELGLIPTVGNKYTTPITSDADGRKFVVVPVNGVPTLFYLSSGKGGKKNVLKDKWYPAFGFGGSWINKTTEKDINNYYGSPELKEMAERLNQLYPKGHPELEAAPNATNTEYYAELVHNILGYEGVKNGDPKLYENIANHIARIEANRPQQTKTTPTKTETPDAATPVPTPPKAKEPKAAKKTAETGPATVPEPKVPVESPQPTPQKSELEGLPGTEVPYKGKTWVVEKVNGNKITLNSTEGKGRRVVSVTTLDREIKKAMEAAQRQQPQPEAQQQTTPEVQQETTAPTVPFEEEAVKPPVAEPVVETTPEAKPTPKKTRTKKAKQEKASVETPAEVVTPSTPEVTPPVTPSTPEVTQAAESVISDLEKEAQIYKAEKQRREQAARKEESDRVEQQIRNQQAESQLKRNVVGGMPSTTNTRVSKGAIVRRKDGSDQDRKVEYLGRSKTTGDMVIKLEGLDEQPLVFGDYINVGYTPVEVNQEQRLKETREERVQRKLQDYYEDADAPAEPEPSIEDVLAEVGQALEENPEGYAQASDESDFTLEDPEEAAADLEGTTALEREARRYRRLREMRRQQKETEEMLNRIANRPESEGVVSDEEFEELQLLEERNRQALERAEQADDEQSDMWDGYYYSETGEAIEASPVEAAELRHIVNEFANTHYKGIDESKVMVVKDMAALRKLLDDPNIPEVEGMITRDDFVFLVADQIRGMSIKDRFLRGLRVLYHEVHGHGGIRKMLGSKRAADEFAVRLYQEREAEINKWYNERYKGSPGRTMEQAKDANPDAGGHNSMAVRAHEWLAQNYAERGIQDYTYIDKLYLGAKGLFGAKNLDLTDAGIRKMYAEYQGKVRQGVTPRQAVGAASAVRSDAPADEEKIPTATPSEVKKDLEQAEAELTEEQKENIRIGQDSSRMYLGSERDPSGNLYSESQPVPNSTNLRTLRVPGVDTLRQDLWETLNDEYSDTVLTQLEATNIIREKANDIIALENLDDPEMRSTSKLPTISPENRVNKILATLFPQQFRRVPLEEGVIQQEIAEGERDPEFTDPTLAISSQEDGFYDPSEASMPGSDWALLFDHLISENYPTFQTYVSQRFVEFSPQNLLGRMTDAGTVQPKEVTQAFAKQIGYKAKVVVIKNNRKEVSTKLGMVSNRYTKEEELHWDLDEVIGHIRSYMLPRKANEPKAQFVFEIQSGMQEGAGSARGMYTQDQIDNLLPAVGETLSPEAKRYRTIIEAKEKELFDIIPADQIQSLLTNPDRKQLKEINARVKKLTQELNTYKKLFARSKAQTETMLHDGQFTDSQRNNYARGAVNPFSSTFEEAAYIDPMLADHLITEAYDGVRVFYFPTAGQVRKATDGEAGGQNLLYRYQIRRKLKRMLGEKPMAGVGPFRGYDFKFSLVKPEDVDPMVANVDLDAEIYTAEMFGLGPEGRYQNGSDKVFGAMSELPEFIKQEIIDEHKRQAKAANLTQPFRSDPRYKPMEDVVIREVADKYIGQRKDPEYDAEKANYQMLRVEIPEDFVADYVAPLMEYLRDNPNDTEENALLQNRHYLMSENYQPNSLSRRGIKGLEFDTFNELEDFYMRTRPEIFRAAFPMTAYRYNEEPRNMSERQALYDLNHRARTMNVELGDLAQLYEMENITLRANAKKAAERNDVDEAVRAETQLVNNYLTLKFIRANGAKLKAYESLAPERSLRLSAALPKRNTFLQLRSTLAEQSPHVRNMLEDMYEADLTGQQIYDRMVDQLGDEQAASMEMLMHGIRGVQDEDGFTLFNDYDPAIQEQYLYSESGQDHPPNRLSNKNFIQKAIRLIKNFFDPFNELGVKGANQYRAYKNRFAGVIGEVEETFGGLARTFEDATDVVEIENIFKAFTLKEREEREAILALLSPERQAKILEAREAIQETGRRLLAFGLISEDSLNKYDGGYLPRKYMIYLLEDPDRKAFAAGRAVSSLDYLKFRRDISPNIREFWGEIKDPTFLTARALIQPNRDMALLELFKLIKVVSSTPEQRRQMDLAENPFVNLPADAPSDQVERRNRLNKSGIVVQDDLRYDWVREDSFVSINYKNILEEALEQTGYDWVEVLREDVLEMNDKNRSVTATFLIKEADRVEDMANNTMGGTKADYFLKVAAILRRLGRENALGENHDRSQWEKVPDLPRYGAFAGMLLRKEIYDDLLGDLEITNALGQTKTQEFDKTLEAFTDLWKWGKVPANVPSWFKNGYGNMMMMALAGMPLHEQLIRNPKAIMDVFRHEFNIKTSEDYEAYKKEGLTKSTFSANELREIDRASFDRLKTAQTPQEFMTFMFKAKVKGKDSYHWLREITGKIYQAIEVAHKLSFARYMEEKRGMTKSEALIEANKPLFDYSEVTPMIRRARRSVLGAPFITWIYKATPFFANFLQEGNPLRINPETGRRGDPRVYLRLLPILALNYGIYSGFKYAWDDEEEETFENVMPDWVKNKGSLITPIGGDQERNNVLMWDMQYIIPYGSHQALLMSLFRGDIKAMLKEAGAVSNPIMTSIIGATTGYDAFRDRPIARDEDALPSELVDDYFWWAYDILAPQMMATNGLARKIIDASAAQAGVYNLPIFGESTVLDTHGRVKTNLYQTLAYALGINTYGFDLGAEMNKRLSNLRYRSAKVTSELKDKMERASNAGFLTEELQQEYEDTAREKMSIIADELQKLDRQSLQQLIEYFELSNYRR